MNQLFYKLRLLLMNSNYETNKRKHGGKKRKNVHRLRLTVITRRTKGNMEVKKGKTYTGGPAAEAWSRNHPASPSPTTVASGASA